MSGIDQAVVDAVLEDHRTAPIEEPVRAALELVYRLTTEPDSFGPEHIEAALEAGLDERAIHEAMYVCFAFNVIDRLADAFEFEIHDATHQGITARMLGRLGYWPSALPG
ncbi:MAG: hypothetical protein AAF799_09500 [Myxococcota bacterium]